MKSKTTTNTISIDKSDLNNAPVSASREAAGPSIQSCASQLWELFSLAYLITESNIKSYVLPVVLFVLCSISSGRVTTNPRPSWQEIVWACPHITLYIWLAVFHFDCSNQKDPKSVEEDKINKPWRAIPSGRLSIEGARTWYIIATGLLVSVSGLWLGGFPEVLVLMAETYVYDYASGASSWWARNLINALFYSTGQLAGIRVATMTMTDTTLTRAGYEWCFLLGLCTLTTIQIQDLRDQEGDRACGRSTMPLSFGDRPTRWITTLFIWFWSITCPMYWASTAGCILPLLIGFYVGVRVLIYNDVEADRKSFHIHTLLWLPSLYSVPLLSKFRLLS